jgi:hypothetical protein
MMPRILGLVKVVIFEKKRVAGRSSSLKQKPVTRELELVEERIFPFLGPEMSRPISLAEAETALAPARAWRGLRKDTVGDRFYKQRRR